MSDYKAAQRNTVAVFGFSQKEMNIIRSYLPANAMELYDAECVTDLYVLDHTVVIVNVYGISKDDLNQLLSYYNEVQYFLETVLFVGDCDGKIANNHISFYVDFESLCSSLKYVLLAASKHKKSAESFSRSISYALIILKEITENPGISSKELSTRLEISQRSVTRYIETLNMAGESIVYNRKNNGWSLEYGESLLKL